MGSIPAVDPQLGYIPPVGAKNKKQEEEQIKSAPAYIAELQVGYIPPVGESTQSHREGNKKRGSCICRATGGIYSPCRETAKKKGEVSKAASGKTTY